MPRHPRLASNDVFVPNMFPTHTYVQRADIDVERLLREGLETRGQIVSLSGPSKSGKTVLVEKVVSQDKLTVVTGGQIEKPESLWDEALTKLGEPHQTSAGEGSGTSGTASVGVKGGVGIPIIASGEMSASGSMQSSGQTSSSMSVGRRGMTQVVELLANTDQALLLDDFHYIAREVQEKIARQLKEAARQGVRIVVAAVTHRSDDVIRALPDLRGRVSVIDLPYWDHASLVKIAELGFAALNMKIDAAAVSLFATESVGSPQLMQANCLHACFELGVTERCATLTEFTVDQAVMLKIFQRTARQADHRTLVELLLAGPKASAAERNVYKWKHGGSGDVYACVLRAMSLDPVAQSFKYSDLLARVQNLCDGASPPGASVSTTCQQMSKIAADNRPENPVLEWDNEKSVLTIVDPYLLFYLRWSGSRSPSATV